MERISVVVVTYQGSRWIEAQAGSIARQSRPPDEVLVVDDASTDATIARAVEALAPVAERVRVLRSDHRLGVTSNYERAIRAATGDVIVLADQDDVWLPHKLETVALWSSADTTGGMFSDGWIIDADGTRTGERLWERAGWNRRRGVQWSRDPLAALLVQPLVTGATMAVRRDTLDLILPIPDIGWHDYAISLLVAATSGLTMIDDPLIEYRLHGANTAGLGPRSRRERVQSHEVHRANLYDQGDLFTELARRLDRHGHGSAAARMMAKADVLRRRAALPTARVWRAGGVARLATTGGYHRYAQGWASAARDLLWP